MLDITLTPEQLQQAPPEVRRWIEGQIAGAPSVSRSALVEEAPAGHLVGCDAAQARAILSLIKGVLPVAGVFFELAHEPIGVTRNGLHVLAVEEIQRHCSLQRPDQVTLCLATIDAALQHLTGAADVVLTALDGAGHCLVADETAAAILSIWQEITAMNQPIGADVPIFAVPVGGFAAALPAPRYETGRCGR